METAHLFEFREGRNSIPKNREFGMIADHKTSFTYLYDFGDDWTYDQGGKNTAKTKTIQNTLFALLEKWLLHPKTAAGLWGFMIN